MIFAQNYLTDTTCVIVMSETLDYSAVDIDTWSHGAEFFRQFWKIVPIEIKKQGVPLGDLRELQAIFLAERALTVDNHLALDLAEYLEPFGLVCLGRFVYMPQYVDAIMQLYTEIFKSFSDPATLIAYLSSQLEINNYPHLYIGLLLGFPLESVQHYAQHFQSIPGIFSQILAAFDRGEGDQQLGREFFWALINRDREWLRAFCEKYEIGLNDPEVATFMNDPSVRFGACNIYWIDWEPLSHNSLRTRDRLQAAFELSGMIDIF